MEIEVYSVSMKTLYNWGKKIDIPLTKTMYLCEKFNFLPKKQLYWRILATLQRITNGENYWWLSVSSTLTDLAYSSLPMSTKTGWHKAASESFLLQQESCRTKELLPSVVVWFLIYPQEMASSGGQVVTHCVSHEVNEMGKERIITFQLNFWISNLDSSSSPPWNAIEPIQVKWIRKRK